MSRSLVLLLLVVAGLAGAGAHALLDDGDPPRLHKAVARPAPVGSEISCAQRAAQPAPDGRFPRGGSLRCLGVPARYAPPDPYELRAYPIGQDMVLVSYLAIDDAEYRVVQRRGSTWRQVFRRKHWGSGAAGIRLGDVTQDRIPDVLVQGSSGSGGCGVRDVLRVTRRAIRPLLLKENQCEVSDELTDDGLILHRDTIGPCPRGKPYAHCYGGVRTRVMGWTGSRLTTDRTVVRCLRARLDPTRDCRRRG